MCLQWNLSKADTCRANIFVRFRQMSTLDGLSLWDFDQQTDILGQNILPALSKCPLYSISALDGFHCSAIDSIVFTHDKIDS